MSALSNTFAESISVEDWHHALCLCAVAHKINTDRPATGYAEVNYFQDL